MSLCYAQFLDYDAVALGCVCLYGGYRRVLCIGDTFVHIVAYSIYDGLLWCLCRMFDDDTDPYQTVATANLALQCVVERYVFVVEFVFILHRVTSSQGVLIVKGYALDVNGYFFLQLFIVGYHCIFSECLQCRFFYVDADFSVF